MPTYQPQPAVLDPIETASTDELRPATDPAERHAAPRVRQHRPLPDRVRRRGLHGTAKVPDLATLAPQVLTIVVVAADFESRRTALLGRRPARIAQTLAARIPKA